jgi:serine/threonine-protein kinase
MGRLFRPVENTRHEKNDKVEIMAQLRTGTGTVVIGDKASTKGGTLVIGQGSLDATIDSRSLDATMQGADGSEASPPSLTATLARTTVLPRVSANAGAVQLVRSDRPRYERQGLLGQGGVGEVVRTKDNDIERLVAVKRLKADMRSPGHLVRFVDEIRTIGSMEHPNIVPIHDVGVDEDGQYFFVMKYVDGETLEHVIDKLAAGDPLYHARYGVERRVEIFLGILEAVAYAHARGVIHRDIKPANIMVGPYGEVTVMDWGLARKIRDPKPEVITADSAPATESLYRTGAGTLLGTPAYMSPEQARAEALDERSDIYSLTVLFHELLCLQHYLHDATTLEIMLAGVQTKKHTTPSFVSAPGQGSAPMELSHYVAKGLQKDPAKRYQTVQEMIDRLRRRAEGYVPIECPVTFTKRATTGWSHFLDRHPMVVMALMTLAILGAGGWGVLHAIK